MPRRFIPVILAAVIVAAGATWAFISLGGRERRGSGLGTGQMGMIVKPDPIRDWTFMVYMNGDNDLERYALQDFREMAEVGSSAAVNIVVQFDRNPGYDDDDGDWSDTRRFLIRRDMDPTLANALPGFAQEVDMASGAALRAFVGWAMQQFPARRYALVIWDHGEGWRFFANRPGWNATERSNAIAWFDSTAAHTRSTTTVEVTDRPPIVADKIVWPSRERRRTPTGEWEVQWPRTILYDHPVRSVSHDMTSGRQMYNRAIQDNLETLLAGRRLDLIGFDACLMAMVEVGYALRNVGDVMVASEDLEPGTGWLYSAVLRPLVATPSMNAADLGRVIVDAYKAQYDRSGQQATLSAVRLKSIGDVALAGSRFGDELSRRLTSGELGPIASARRGCKAYAPGYQIHNVDANCFTDRVATSATDTVLRASARAFSQALKSAVIASYADRRRRRPDYVSDGLAIYFPASGALFNADRLAGGYRNGVPASSFPVQFVDDHRWDEFIRDYAQRVP